MDIEINNYKNSFDNLTEKQLNLFNAGESEYEDSGSLLLSQESPMFREDFNNALRKLAFTQEINSLELIDIESELKLIDKKEPLPENEADKLAEVLFSNASRLALTSTNDMQSFLELQKNMMALFSLVEDYGNITATKNLPHLLSKIDPTHSAYGQLKEKIINMASQETLALKGIKRPLSSEEKTEKIRHVHYALFLASQLFLDKTTDIENQLVRLETIQKAEERMGAKGRSILLEDKELKTPTSSESQQSQLFSKL